VLWEVSSEKIYEIAKTRQFGNGTWNWIGVKLLELDHAVDKLGNEYHVHRKEITNYWVGIWFSCTITTQFRKRLLSPS
jgi:hypothetical protein